MAIPNGAVRVVLSGTLAGGEIWSTGFWMMDTGVTDSATAAALALIIEGTLSSTDASGAMTVTMQDLCNIYTKWMKVTVYLYTSGSGKASAVGEYTLPTPMTGGQSRGLPNQVASCLTLRTGLAGRNNRGRMYLPCSGATLLQDGQLNQGDLISVVTAWATAFHDIDVSDAGHVVVVSNVASTSHRVSEVKMDSRLDVMRSRANHQSIDFISTHAVAAV